ncbi:hypothetical protein [Paludibacterium denitrificans]|uniref:Uncharacterized protein n=1 Tax=Paludibacterium denitrificans TaxID=2675226 RepID=A0A844GDT0_9NEIS|nr:hypothetical protein [Paludibacterium denitrificans]MTD33809.1 hypothetical protein [Paludibacterium denitrificans]
MMGASWLDLPDTSLTADSTVLYLPMPSTGFLLLWAPTHKEVHLPVQQLFKPVMANLEKSIRLCRHNEDYTHAIEQDRDEAREQLAEQLARTDRR